MKSDKANIFFMVSSCSVSRVDTIPDRPLCQFSALSPFSGRRGYGTKTGKAPFGAAE
jgi:hypothetical protein